MDSSPDLSRDLLVGADVIADYLGVRKRQIYHAAERNYLPLFRFGALICARKSTLTKWVEELDRAPIAPAVTGAHRWLPRIALSLRCSIDHQVGRMTRPYPSDTAAALIKHVTGGRVHTRPMASFPAIRNASLDQ